ncbi:hypothetical protein RWV98_12175 [Agathobaculum sp. NTUH-O15-33]|uniref:hypothetical protein n=1 Tax=Agathobaculum sp. NTUH-O15-33 TaxID=3079302 RepID=UPI00295887F8|nr:hypothetical protein [Agathobaculum sp. NTUH-O15-33]WNX83366.1 hypothetical protein RWV98_12175 [Agathobaculum sp. NTUH-O15-33]
MTELTLAARFALLSLNAQDSLHMTVAKRMALRCTAAAAVCEVQLDRGFPLDSAFLTAPGDPSLSLYQQAALEALDPQPADTAIDLLARTAHLHDKALAAVERAVTDLLKGRNLLDEVQSLLACDMDFDVQNMDLLEYRAEREAYHSIAEALHTEILTDDQMDDENVLFFFLLRESGCIHDLFSEGEMPTVHVQMQKASAFSPLAKVLFPLDIHKNMEKKIKEFLEGKKNMSTADCGVGLNFLFPVFQRNQSVFIDVEKLYESNEDFLAHVLERLKNHEVEVLRTGKVPLLRIDNVLYEAVPSAVPVGGVGLRVPVYGARLRLYPMFQ